MTIIYITLAWLSGTVAADLLALPLRWWLAGAGSTILVLPFGKRGRLAALIVLAVTLAGARYELARIPTTPRSIWRLVGQPELRVRGEIAADPQRTEEGQRLLVDVSAVVRDGRALPAEGRVLVQLPPYPVYRYGQRLELQGTLTTPRAAERPGMFDYQEYLARRGIFVLMREPIVRPFGDGGNLLLRLLFRLRSRCQGVLLRALPEPQASLAVGILLGLQSSIPDDVYNTFSVTGTSHILVVSGWNMTIISAMLAALASRMRAGRWPTLALTLVVLWAYAMFVGATATVNRAALMASLMALGKATQRRSEPWTLLAAACLGLTILDPQTLWDLGFQLSAAATASLFAFGKGTERLLQRIPMLRWPILAFATEALTATLAAQILALPIILYAFGNLSLIAPLANVVLVPVVPYAMLLGTLALVAGLLWLPLGQVVALGAYLVLAWLTEGARLLAQVPWAATTLPPFPLWVLLAYYVLVIGGWYYARE